MAGKLRTEEWRKNVARDCGLPVSRDIFSSFCRAESYSGSVEYGHKRGVNGMQRGQLGVCVNKLGTTRLTRGTRG